MSDNTINDLIDPHYACAKNIERNSIASDVFQQCVKTTHTIPWKPPKLTIIIESTISKQSNMKKGREEVFILAYIIIVEMLMLPHHTIISMLILF